MSIADLLDSSSCFGGSPEPPNDAGPFKEEDYGGFVDSNIFGMASWLSMAERQGGVGSEDVAVGGCRKGLLLDVTVCVCFGEVLFFYDPANLKW